MTLPGPVPQPNDRLQQEIARLWEALRERDRKTLYSVEVSDGGITVRGAGGIRVIDPNGVERFSASADGVTVRDASDTVIFSNDTTSGWGMALPNIQTPFNRYEPIAADYMGATTFGNSYIASHVVNHPSVVMGANTRITDVGANVEVRYIWSQVSSEPGPGEYTVMGTLSGVGDLGPVTYTFPADMFGQHVYAIMQVRRSAGSGTVTGTPSYFYGQGN